MARALLKYSVSFKIGLKNSMEYRVDFFLKLLSTIFPIIINLFLWTAVYGTTHVKNPYGYTYIQIILYSLLSGVISSIVSTGFEADIAHDIKDGGLNKYIVKPVSYYISRVASFLGEKSIQYAVLLAIITAVLTIFNIFLNLNMEIFRIITFLISLMQAAILNYLIFFAVSALAFWVFEVGYLFWAVGVAINIASGGLFPIEVLGVKALLVLEFLPFKYIIYYPITVISGKLSHTEILYGLLIQLIWICIALAVAKLMWYLGMKKYIAVGG